MGHDGAASGYPTPTGFRKLTGCQRDPWDRGVTKILYVKAIGSINMSGTLYKIYVSFYMNLLK